MQNTVKWLKKGLIYKPDGSLDWSKSHAQVPVVDVLNDCYRVYYSTRNVIGKSNISYVEVDKNDPSNILYQHDKTLLELGKLGTFDDSGTMPSSIVNVGDKKYLYYIGWTARGSVPYDNSIGLAMSEDGGKTFQKQFEGPIITTNHIEPYFSGTSCVIKEKNTFRMWYLSCIEWKVFNGETEPVYNLKYAESSDGIQWKQTGKVAVDLQDGEGGLVSASVIKIDGVYKMWFGKRKDSDYRKNVANTYRIGYAESKDGIDWTRMDENAGIDVSDEGWDSEMISYPNVIRQQNQLLMFYNGNGFGRSGFGYAQLAIT